MQDARSTLKALIEQHVFIRAEQAPQLRAPGSKQSSWIFDFRRITLDPGALRIIARLFWESHPYKKVSIGGLESAAIPLVAALVLHAPKGVEVQGFFIRKSRKKHGLAGMIEGTIYDDAPIVLVDDIINSGKSMLRQHEALNAIEKPIDALWTLLQFRDDTFYKPLTNTVAPLHSVFVLNDFTDTLGVRNLTPKTPHMPMLQWHAAWKFAAPAPNYLYVVPKSTPAIDDTRVYVGADNGTLYAVTQHDGTIAWQQHTGAHKKGKGIFSSPLVHNGTVYVGAYDGNVYAYHAATGALRWISFEADWVGSSPTIAPSHNTLFIGLEFGLFRKRGGIIALDATTGKKKWSYTMPCFTHSSPLYIAAHDQVAIGSNDGAVYLFDAQKGSLVWKHDTGTLSEEALNIGFSDYDIKESCAYDEKNDRIICGNKAGTLCAIDRTTGKCAWTFTAEFGFFSTPRIYNDIVYATSLDKHVYALHTKDGTLCWQKQLGARIFSSPTVINKKIYVGANTGRLSVLDPMTGTEEGFLQLAERITNPPVYNPKTKRLFVPTFANEVYCFSVDETKKE